MVKGRMSRESAHQCSDVPPGAALTSSLREVAMEQPGPSAHFSRRQRKLFPLPFFARPEQKAQPCSRPVRQRRERIRRAIENCNQVVKALNWMAGCGPQDEPAPTSCMQSQVMARVEGLVFSQKPSGAIPSAEEALRQLLRGGPPYDWKPINESLASFQPELVSVPEDVRGCPQLVDILSAHDRRYLEEGSELMLRPMEEIPEEALKLQPYWDPKLKFNKKAYTTLVKKLHHIDFFNYTIQPKCEVGVFFVWKSSRTKLRMITDARKSNLHFYPAPGVSLMTSESFGRIEIELDQHGWPDSNALDAVSTFVGLSDVKDCFHRMKVPIWLSRYFSWHPIAAKEVGLSGKVIDGVELGPMDMVYPCAGSLSQGFSWALFFAQKANEQLSGSTRLLREASLAHDRGEPVVLRVGRNTDSKPFYYVYVDNLGVFGNSRAAVEQSMQELQQEFDSRGLILHSSSISDGEVEALGCMVEGRLLRSRITPTRLWKIHQGLLGLVRRGRCTGRTLEVVIGHCTFAGLLNRASLSIFCSVYPFMKKHYREVSALWPSVKNELLAFSGVIFMLCQDWWRHWNPVVSSSDSSLTGYGICQAVWPSQKVAEVGRRLERSRFKRTSGHSARESALVAAGLDGHRELWGKATSSTIRSLSEKGWGIDEHFVEVPAAGLRRELWSPRVWGKWHIPESILILEARTVLLAVRRLAMMRFGHDLRHVHLCDNMAVTLSFERRRSKNFKLLRIIREYAAYCLARNIHVSIRWIPSELNISDEPSRFHDPDDSKLLVDLISDCWGDETFFPQVPPDKKHVTQTAAAVDTNSSSHGQVGQEASQDSGHSHTDTCAEKGKFPSQRTTASEETAEARWGSISQQTFGRAESSDVSPARCGGEGPAQHSDETAKPQRRRDREWKHFVRAEGRRKRKESAWSERQTKETIEESRGLKDGRQLIQLFGNLCDWPEGPGELQEATGWVPEFCVQEWFGDKDRCSDGPGVGEVLQCQVCGGRGQLCGGLCSCIAARPSPRVWPLWSQKDTTSMALHQGLEEAKPYTGEISFPFSSMGCRVVEDGSSWPCSESHLQFGSALHLPPTGQSSEASKDGPCQANWWDHKFLVGGDEFDGDIRRVKDQQQGRQCDAGLGLDSIHASPFGSYLQGEADGSGLEVHVQRVRICLSELLFGPETDTGAVSGSPFRPIDRSRQKSEKSRRSPKTRGLDVKDKCGQVRKERSSSLNMEEAGSADADVLPIRRTLPSRNHARASLPSYPSSRSFSWMRSKGEYVADLFSGHGGVARAVRSQGFTAKEWELLHGPDSDLTRPAVLKRLKRDIFHNRLIAAMLAPPCSSFSPARDRTRVVRNHEYPWGVPNLPEHEQIKVDVGNACVKSTIKIIGWLDQLGLPWVLENPHSSKIWRIPQLRRLIDARHTQVIVTDFCMFNTPWRKRTRLLAGNIDELDLQRCHRRCHGSSGICSRSGKPHFHLTGSNSKGVPWTRVAQPYPPQLCHALCHALIAHRQVVPYDALLLSNSNTKHNNSNSPPTH